MINVKAIWSRLQKRDHDDDTVDRMNYSTTAKILGFFAAIVMAKQNVGSPLQCWVPAEYKKTWEKYIESYCFVENTYYVNSTSATFPNSALIRQEYQLRYYQWTPYIFLFSAFIAYMPKLIFKFLNSFNNLVVLDIIQFAYTKNRKNIRETGAKKMDTKDLSKLIANKLVETRPAHVRFTFTLTVIYLLMKVVQIAGIFINLYVLQYFINAPSIFWGKTLISDLTEGRDWRVNGYFPRVTFCDLQTRDLGQHRPHTVQCVLMLNMFIEKMFIFLWVWFMISAVVSIINLGMWLRKVVSREAKSNMIANALIQSGFTRVEKAEIERFIQHDLKLDGVLVLQLIDSNLGYINMAETCRQLFDSYIARSE